MYFRKIANNAWDLYANDVGSGVVAKLPGTGTGVAGNTLTGVVTPFDYSTDSISFQVDGTTVTLDQNYVNIAGIVAAVQQQIGGNYTVQNAGGALSITNNISLTPPVINAYNGNVDGNGTSVPNVITGGATTAGSVPSLQFSAAGSLSSPSGPFAQPVTSPLVSGATMAALSIGFTGTTQFGNTFSVNSLTQDGYTTGRLAGVSVGQDGTIQGRYTNGQSRALGQIILANFTNPNGLSPLGNNQFSETADSGAPLIGSPGSGRLGVIQAAAVEESNVDLTAELVNLITQQRNYQANAQSIKTQDQVLSTLVNLR
jgi:flagellar hook-basal body protein